MNTETKFTGASSGLLGTFSNFQGVQVSLARGSSADYLSMRAKHLSALSRIICDEEFKEWDESTKDGMKWLASSLADEICALVPLAIADRR